MAEVFLIAEAEEDIFDIYRYVARNDSPAKGAQALQKPPGNHQLAGTSTDQRAYPPELARVEVREFLEIHHKPYRIIYQIIHNDVYVHGVLDGRRDLETLLQKRLLRI